jgi:SAM-dependent methyltransferase
MTRQPIDWDAYLSDFHADHPGITEDILARSTHEGRTPYQWLLEGANPAARILDLGCGTGPARPESADRWVGIDRSAGELRRAANQGRGPLLRGDVTRLPIADACADVATSSMAMMLVRPLDAALQEVVRVLRPGGELRLLLPTPTPAPITLRDTATYLRLFWSARSPTKFPHSHLRSTAAETLESHGLSIVSDERRRFAHRVDDPTGADRFIDSWYLPNTTTSRHESARRRAASMAPFEIGIPLRRIVARRP